MNKRNSVIRFIRGIAIGGLAVALLLPLSFYFITKSLSKNALHMPRYFVTDRIDSQVVNNKMIYDTIYHKVSDVILVNQLGKTISLDTDLKGKLLLVDFFFVNCPTICPRLTRNMGLMQHAFKKNDTTVQFISITVNPGHDSFPVLRAYADRYGANHDHWWFLTGDKKNIYNFARNELFISVQPGDGGENDFIHTEKFVLLDKDRYIRGYYNGLDSADLKRCADDIILVSYENKHPKKHLK